MPTLFIDWLELTIPIEAERIADVQQRLDDAERWCDGISAERGRGRYRYVYKIELPVQYPDEAPERSRITIQSSPRTNAGSYLKLTYSPNNAGEAGRTLLTGFLQCVLGGDFRNLFYAGTVNRADISFDVHRIPIRDLWVRDVRDRPRKSAIVRGRDLQAETLYFGFKTSRQLIVYDKGAEQGRPRDAIPWTRIEYRYAKGDYRLGELYTRLRGSPFDGFVIRRYVQLPAPIEPAISRAIFDALRLRGDRRGGEIDQDLSRYSDAFPYWRTWTRRNSIWIQLQGRIDELLLADV